MSRITDQVVKNRRRWIRALNSGKYEQGDGQLKVDDTFCCLGVACDISGLGEWGAGEYYEIGERDEDGDVAESDMYSLDNLPSVRRRISLSKKLMDRLAEMNDSGMTFKDIAKHLRAVWRRV